MTIRFIVTRNARHIPQGYQVFMVDGHVRNYKFKKHDKIWDHHKEGGADCQILEMPMAHHDHKSLLDEKKINSNVAIVTTVYDPDAIIAAVWLIAKKKYLLDYDISCLLHAVSLMCDHLVIPDCYEHLHKYKNKAATVVAVCYEIRETIRKDLNLSAYESNWTDNEQVFLDSKAFEYMVSWFINALYGSRDWPQHHHQLARSHWQRVNKVKKEIIKSNILYELNNVCVYDARKVYNRDPRAAYSAIKKLGLDNNLHFMTIWNHEKGSSFTFWTNPDHPNWKDVNLYQFINVFNDITWTKGGARRTWGGTQWGVDILKRISVEKTTYLLQEYGH